jgi:hypothetical protein
MVGLLMVSGINLGKEVLERQKIHSILGKEEETGSLPF